MADIEGMTEEWVIVPRSDTDVDDALSDVALWSGGAITIPADQLHVGDQVILWRRDGECYAEVKHLTCMTAPFS